MDAPICDCGCKVFTLEERQAPIEKEYIPAKEFWDKSVWQDYLNVNCTYLCAVCEVCKKSYRI